MIGTAQTKDYEKKNKFEPTILNVYESIIF